jgi:CBS domain-containing protein
MSVGELCNREVIVIEPEGEVRAAARLMREHHVGDLVVVKREGSTSIPVGILTDRDLVVEILAQDVDAADVTVGDVMSGDLVTARATDDLWDTLERMRARAVRRVPVVDAAGGLVGILAADDVLELLAEGITDLATLIGRERRQESERRP